MGKAKSVLEVPRAQSGALGASKNESLERETASGGSAISRDARHLDPKELGLLGELAAVRFLKRHGFDILEQNWKCLAGEADIIAREDDSLVFVEVKTRAGVDKGLPEEAVNKKKRQRYERIAALYLSTYEVADIQVRFDIISILVVAADRALLRHHRSAFSAST